jgi:hypothetical protein
MAESTQDNQTFQAQMFQQLQQQSQAQAQMEAQMQHVTGSLFRVLLVSPLPPRRRRWDHEPPQPQGRRRRSQVGNASSDSLAPATYCGVVGGLQGGWSRRWGMPLGSRCEQLACCIQRSRGLPEGGGRMPFFATDPWF